MTNHGPSPDKQINPASEKQRSPVRSRLELAILAARTNLQENPIRINYQLQTLVKDPMSCVVPGPEVLARDKVIPQLRITSMVSLQREIQEQLERNWQLAAEQLRDHAPELGKCMRLCIAVRAIALYQNSRVRIKTAQLTMFIPNLLLAHWIGCTERYLYTVQSRFDTNGMFSRLCNARPWKTSISHRKTTRNVNGGTIWVSKCQPMPIGQRPKLTMDDIKHDWRDLDKDIKNGHTAAKLLKETRRSRKRNFSSVSNTPDRAETQILVEYLSRSLCLETSTHGVNSDAELGARGSIYSVLDMLSEPVGKGHQARVTWVSERAVKIAHFLHDRHSLDFWMKAFWVIIRARALGFGDPASLLYDALWDVCIRSGDNKLLRKPAALVIATMRAGGWFEIEVAVSSFKTQTLNKCAQALETHHRTIASSPKRHRQDFS